jgi:hypothetical protein
MSETDGEQQQGVINYPFRRRVGIGPLGCGRGGAVFSTPRSARSKFVLLSQKVFGLMPKNKEQIRLIQVFVRKA